MTADARFDLSFPRVAEVVASAGVSALLTMAYIIYSGRVLGPEEYADFAASLSVIYFAGLALSPLSPAVARLCARFLARGDHRAVAALRRRTVIRVALYGGGVAVAGMALAPSIARGLEFRSAVPLVLVFAIVFVYALLSVDRGVVQGLLSFRVYNVNTVLEAALRWAFVALLFLVSRSAGAGMASYFAAMIVAEAALALRFHREWANDDTAIDWQEVRRVTVPLAVLMISVATLQNADMLIVKRFFTAAESGAYGAATALARAIGIVFVPLYVIAGPILAGLYESGQRMLGTTVRFTALFIALAVIPLVVMMIWPELIVTTLYGPDFRMAAPLLVPLAGVAIILYTSVMLSQALITIENQRFLVVYGVLAIAQVAVLWRFHATFRQIFSALYAIQTLVLVVVAAFLVSAHKETAKQPVDDAIRQQ